MDVVIRSEGACDVDAISHVTKAAFADCPYGNHTEQFIIVALRAANALSVSLVADAGGAVVGHVAFSPVSVSEGGPGWYGLGPISVLPALQKRGIGTALMQHGLAALRALGGKGCVLVGDPGFYERFGFRNWPGLTVEGVPDLNVLALPLEEGDAPRGVATFHKAFAATG